MKKIIKVQQPSDAPLNLTWMINNICTNHCSYCPSDLHAGKNHHYEWKNAKRFFEMLFDRYPKIHCAVSGGEPSISPFFPEICKTFYDAGHHIGATSNAAKPAAYWKDISKYLNYICFSWHPEFADNNFVEKITVASLETFVLVRVMMLPNKWDECVKTFKELSTINTLIVEPVKILNYEDIDALSYAYTKEQLEWFDTNEGTHVKFNRYGIKPNKPHVPNISSTYYLNDGEIITNPNASIWVNRNMTNFNGYTCEIGLKSLFVRPDGSIYRGNCLVGGIIGNINSPDKIQWPTEPIKCNVNLCHCSTDVNINKWID